MYETRNLALPQIAPSQAQKHVTHNEALRRLDAVVQLGVVARDRAAPPPAPEDGDRYIVADEPGGEWLGQAGRVAAYQDGAWAFLEPRAGWIAFVGEEDLLLVHDGTDWTASPFAGEIVGAPIFGINTAADPYNRLFVKSNSVLFSHDDVSGGGNGSVLGAFNKAETTRDAGFAFQSNYATRALMGLYGDDDFRIKLTPDGTTYFDALVVDRTSGRVALPHSAPPKLGGPFTGSQAIESGSETILTVFAPDTNTLADSTFQDGILTIGWREAGLWYVEFASNIPGGAAPKAVRIEKNGVTFTSTEFKNVSENEVLKTVGVVQCDPGDQIAFAIYQATGAEQVPGERTRFFAYRIGG